MEDFVTYKVAKKLKEAGFSQDYGCYGCKFIYSDETTIKRISEIGAYDSDYYGENLPCPTIAQVLKWLREEKKLHIAVDIWSREWGYDVLRLMGGDSLHWSGISNYKNYEEAALAGIEYVLYNLKEDTL